MQNPNTPDYKSTIRLPQTDFPMKGDLPLREPQIIAGWEKNNIYQKLQEKNAKGPGFTMPDGPPYANGSIHIGHALNKSLKDFVIKYKNMNGFSAPFIPGWDCHGLPIEHKVMKDLTDKKITKTDQEILALCREEAQKWVNHQREQFKRLGVLADWENPYLTMSKPYEAEEVREFARAFKRGVIYQGVKPVYWNWTLKTALADAEIEYHDKVSPAIYVKFNVTDDKTLAKLGNPKGTTSFVIWTTTPWTLPANTGIALHPEFDYGVYSTARAEGSGTLGENLVIAKSLKEFFEKDTGLTLQNLLTTVKGADLELTEARHPFLDRKSVVVLGDHVTADAGTGAVHTAPGHGADDFRVGQKYNLPVINPVAENGTYTDEYPEMQGMNIFKANPVIIEKLKASGHLLAHKDITHSYPHCWRSKTPLIFRTTAQWFIGIDQETSEIRKNTLKAMEEVQFFPEWGKARFEAMMQNRPDWCVSRQRIWGVPIPIFYHEETGKPLADFDIMMRAADVIEKGGIEAYYTTPAEQIVGKPGYRHGRDILDVWFDSGVCHAAVQARRGYKNVVADIYLEGSDQHRGWFNTSMLSSMATTGHPPFKALITHGFVNDSQGRKMSKSLGNVIDPNEISKVSGSEIVRLWAASVDYGTDVGCGKEELTRVTETYRKMRNTMRFLLGAINDFDAKDAVEVSKMPMIDRWMMHQLNKLIIEVTKAYDAYEFYRVYQLLNHFFTVTLSATYMDILKDRLYTWKHNGLERKATQTVYHHVTTSVMRMMAPILTFLSEESYGYLKDKAHDSVLLESFPKANTLWADPKLDITFDELLKVRSEAQKKLEELRAAKTIGASLEASLKVSAEGGAFTALEELNNSHAKCNLREFFIVSNVTLVKGPLEVTAVKADGEKCVRCWVYDKLSTAESTQGLCPKCVEALA
ncbi:MAG: isoleucine--tRNA ligase [Pseudobdellovibrio sp.]|nr:isoleucine--tRNA ligase [Pseudobdellovibrio sp.]